MKANVIPFVLGLLGTIAEGSKRRLEELDIRGNAVTNRTKINRNTRKSPGASRRLAVTQISVKNYLLTLV